MVLDKRQSASIASSRMKKQDLHQTTYPRITARRWLWVAMKRTVTKKKSRWSLWSRMPLTSASLIFRNACLANSRSRKKVIWITKRKYSKTISIRLWRPQTLLIMKQLSLWHRNRAHNRYLSASTRDLMAQVAHPRQEGSSSSRYWISNKRRQGWISRHLQPRAIARATKVVIKSATLTS